jgi:hypothetical protein
VKNDERDATEIAHRLRRNDLLLWGRRSDGIWPSVGRSLRPVGGRVALSFEEAPFGWVGGQLDRAVVGGDGWVMPSGPGEEVGARGVVGLVVLERGRVERVEGVETGGGAAQLADGDGPVEGGHRVGAHGVELVVEGDDLGPVGGRGGGGVGVDGGDGRLDLERAGLVAAQARTDEVVSFGDEQAIP